MDSTAVGTTSLLEVLTIAQRDLARRVTTVIAAEGFTVDQWLILRTLADGVGHPMGELADALRIANPTLTRYVDGLIDQSMVYRRQDDGDRRRVSVHLARQGRAQLTRLDALVAAQEAALRTTEEWTRLAAAIGGARDGS